MDEMREAESIRETVDAFIAAVNRGDPEAVIAFHSSAPQTQLIGTDEEEWYSFKRYAAWVREHVGSLSAEVADVTAFEENGVGWMAARMTIVEGAERMETRFTGVLHREDEEWKFVQRHVSVGRVSSAELLK